MTSAIAAIIAILLLKLLHTRAFGPDDSIEALRALPG